MADAYRIPSGHVGGGRFAHRGDVGQALVHAVKSVYHDMKPGELDAEHRDVAASIEHLHNERESKSAELAAFVEGATNIHGTTDRGKWPASASHHAKELDDRLAAIDKSITEYHGIADEIHTARAPHAERTSMTARELRHAIKPGDPGEDQWAWRVAEGKEPGTHTNTRDDSGEIDYTPGAPSLHDSIRQHGVTKPVTLNRNPVHVADGHHRIAAAYDIDPDMDIPIDWEDHPPEFNDLDAGSTQRALTGLAGLHHQGLGVNGLSVATLPMIANNERWRGRQLPAETQAAAIDAMFNPVNDPPIPQPVVIDGPGTIRSVAVNLDTGQVLGSTRPLGPDTAPPYGRWATLPADHPDAPALITAGWLATPETQQYITGDLLPSLRHGVPTDPAYPALAEAAVARSNDILDDYRADRDLPVRRVTEPGLGTYYVPDDNGPLSLDGAAARFADFGDDGTTRLWASDAAVAQPDPRDPLSRIDYTIADDDTLPWDQRVAALADARRELQRLVGATPGDLFTQPTEDDFAAIVGGQGGDREFAVLNAFDRFGESADRLVRARTADLARQPDKKAVIAKLREVGVPSEVADFIEAQPWSAARVTGLVRPEPGAPEGGGLLTVSFPDDPDTRIVVFTSALPGRAQTQAAWEFSADYQIAHPDAFVNMAPTGRVVVPPTGTGHEWYADVVDTGNIARTGDDTPAMTAFLETMMALGVDMGTDPNLKVQAAVHLGGRDYRPTAPPTLATDADREVAAVVDVGLRPYPKSWTATIGEKVPLINVDPERDTVAGTSGDLKSDSPIIDLPSVIAHPDYADAATHEFAHLFERTVGGLMLIETWHFLQRLRIEAARSNKLSTWTWSDTHHGYRDDFGDEYMGRVYTSGTTGRTGVTVAAGHEILSTVTQGLWGGYARRTDPDLDLPARRLLLALMAVLDPPAPVHS